MNAYGNFIDAHDNAMISYFTTYLHYMSSPAMTLHEIFHDFSCPFMTYLMDAHAKARHEVS